MWFLVKRELNNKKNIFLLIGALILFLIRTVADIAMPIILIYMNKIIEQVYSATSSADHLSSQNGAIAATILIVILFFVGLVSFGTGSFGNVLGAKLNANIIRKIRMNLYNKIQYFSNSDFDNFKTSTLITRITTDLYSLETAFNLVFSIGLRSLMLYLGGIIGVIACVVNPELRGPMPPEAVQNLWIIPVTVFLFSILMLAIAGILIIRGSTLYGKSILKTDKANSVMRENILGVRVVKSFNLQDEQTERFEKTNKDLTRSSTKAWLVSQLGFPAVTFVMNAAMVAVIAIGKAKGTLLVGNVMALIQLISIMMIGLILFIVVVGQVASASASSKRIKEVTIYKPKIDFSETTEEIENGQIVFKNVDFKYTEDSENVLSDINLTIKENETVGIIGGTGSGKSTLINLITRGYDVTGGELLISNKNVKTITRDSLRNSISISPQLVTLFSGTIQSNLEYGKSLFEIMQKENVSQEEAQKILNKEMTKATKIASAYEFILKKEAMFDSVVEQRGKNFSGGQKQRISIARALIKDSKILILDDSTSALDMITEKEVQEQIKKEKNKTTKIMVAQRISSVKLADKIVVLDKGHIVGVGKHTELLQSCKIYKEIAISQLGEKGVKNEIKNG